MGQKQENLLGDRIRDAKTQKKIWRSSKTYFIGFRYMVVVIDLKTEVGHVQLAKLISIARDKSFSISLKLFCCSADSFWLPVLVVPSLLPWLTCLLFVTFTCPYLDVHVGPFLFLKMKLK